MIAALAALALLTNTQPADADIRGLWRTPVDGGLVRIETCGRDVCGILVQSAALRADPDRRDLRNADPRLRTRPLGGLRLLQARPAGPARWTDGWVYNPEDGRTYRGSLRLRTDGRLELTGCVVRPLCRTQVWTRATD